MLHVGKTTVVYVRVLREEFNGTLRTVHVCIYICTIDAWAFKGTATGTYPMYHSEDLNEVCACTWKPCKYT